jgi:C4-dicarboxylate-specific signal transduction histidine kinase
MADTNLEDLIQFSQYTRVLYVSSDGTMMEETLGVLGIFFHNIDTAVDGLDGFKSFEKKKYDLIITSIDMPNMNGIEMITKIREISKHITILVISSNTDHFIDLIKLGIDGYLLKPIEFEQFTNILQKVLEKLQNKHELFEYKKHLEQRVEEEVEKRQAQEKVLVQQSKLAAMGEMMDAVAHQWKQPINIMSMHVEYLEYDFEDGILDLEKIHEFQSNFNQQKNHMLETLEEFRSFFRPNKATSPFLIEKSLNSIMVLIRDEFVNNKISIELSVENDFIINGIENEFKHVILNIINNSKDAFNENGIENRKIFIKAYSESDKNIITLQDNAGGIPAHIIDNIFHANVTSKAEGKGTGIGLYMSSQIVEKYQGTINVSNCNNGAKFTIKLPK